MGTKSTFSFLQSGRFSPWTRFSGNPVKLAAGPKAGRSAPARQRQPQPSVQLGPPLFPGKDLSTSSREVRNLGGGVVTVQGPIELSVEVCNFLLKHLFYFYKCNPTFLMGFDLITKVSFTIDAESCCVWSKHTLRCHISQDLANATAKPIIQVNTDPFLKTVHPISLPPTDTLNENSKNSILDETPTPLSMTCHPLSSTSSKPTSCLPSSSSKLELRCSNRLWLLFLQNDLAVVKSHSILTLMGKPLFHVLTA